VETADRASAHTGIGQPGERAAVKEVAAPAPSRAAALAFTRTVTLTVTVAAALAAPAALAGDAAAGKQKAEQCVACHGETGNSSDPQFPRLAGQHADYLVKALEDYKSGARDNAIMAGFAQGLSEQDRADLAAWYASQGGGLAIIEYTK